MASPTVQTVTATTAVITWGAPTDRNGVILSYRLRLRPAASETWTVAFNGLGLAATVANLSAYTRYALQLAVYTSAGPGLSSVVEFVTMESGTLMRLMLELGTDLQVLSSAFRLHCVCAAPVGQDVPQVTSITSQGAFVSWPAVVQPNGVIVNYTLYLDGDLWSVGLGNAAMVSGLAPFTTHGLYVAVCTSAGCTQSATTSFTTAQASTYLVHVGSVDD